MSLGGVTWFLMFRVVKSGTWLSMVDQRIPDSEYAVPSGQQSGGSTVEHQVPCWTITDYSAPLGTVLHHKENLATRRHAGPWATRGL